MKNNAETLTDKKPVVRIDPALNKYTNVVLFPKKMELMKEDIEKFGLPDFEKVKNQNSSSR